MIYIADGGHDENTWSLQPPQLPDGSYFAPADLICRELYRDTRIVFPLGHDGVRTDLTFFYWQAYVANDRARLVLEQECRSTVWFSPACSSTGEQLWVVRCPNITGCIDREKSILTYHPKYSAKHPLYHVSEQIRQIYRLCLSRDIVESQDLFYLAEYPVKLLISQRLVQRLHERNISGFGCAPESQVELV